MTMSRLEGSLSSRLCGSKRETLHLLLTEPHNGRGAPQARPPERSGATGSPRTKVWGVRGGEAPRI